MLIGGNGSFCLNNHEIKFWSTGSRLSYFLEIPLVENFVSTKLQCISANLVPRDLEKFPGNEVAIVQACS